MKMLLAAAAVIASLAVSAGAVAADKNFLIGFAQDTLANDWRLAQVRELRRELAKYPGVDLMVTDGKGSTARQIRDIEDLVERKVDLLITSPRDSRAMTPAISAAYRRGIPVVLLTRSIEGDDYTTFIGPDDRTIGLEAARHLAEVLDGKGEILMLQGVAGASTTAARTHSFLEELERFPGMRVTAFKVANYLRGDAIRAVEEALRDGIRFDAIYSQSDSMASGARLALRAAGRDPAEMAIVAIDYIGEAREAIRRGEQSASFTYPTCAKEAAEVAFAIAQGKPVPRKITVPSQKVTLENVEQVAPIF